jgi:hypothetical protein
MLQDRFRRMWRDSPRHQLPSDAVWNLVDYLPDLDAPADKRGGWSYYSDNLYVTDGTVTYGEALAYVEFSAGSQIIAIDNNGKLWKILSSPGPSVAKGTPGVPFQNPFLHRSTLVIPSKDGTTGAYYYDGTNNAAAIAGAPAGIYGLTYKDYSILSCSDANLNRIWFSDPGDPATWDTTNSWWDTTHNHTGLAALRNAILIFSAGHVERLRGSIPPAAEGAGSDFELDELFELGCADARSIVNFGDQVVWADGHGVYITDGATYDDLTELGGMKTYYGSLYEGVATPRLVAGTYQNRYVLWIFDAQTLVDTLVCELKTRNWYRFSNIPALAIAHASAALEELYLINAPIGVGGNVRVSKFSTVFSPSATTKNDAEGTAVTPILETPFYEIGSPNLKSWHELLPTFDLRDSASDDPAITVGYITSPEETSYTSITPNLTETTEMTRKSRYLRRSERGLGFRFGQSGASSRTKIYSLQAVVYPQEGTK